MGVAGQFNRHNFGIGGFHGFIGSHDLRTGSGTSAENANGTIFGIKTHLFVDYGIDIGDHNTDGLANGRANEFSHAGVGIGGCGLSWSCARTAPDFIHYLSDNHV